MKSYRGFFPAYTSPLSSSLPPSLYEVHPDDAAISLAAPAVADVSYEVPGAVPLHAELLAGAKALLQTLDEDVYRSLRNRANHYEALGKGCFLNRSAMKLVNLDHEYGVVAPRDGDPSLPFSFVDLCGGPGGFVEYCVLKCRHAGTSCVGFGMTLSISGAERPAMQACNWNVLHLHDPPRSAVVVDGAVASLPPSMPCAVTVHLVNGVTGDGDVTKPENIAALRHLLLETLPPLGRVDLCSADGFDTEADDAFVLVLSQVVGMLTALAAGGCFVLKVFACESPQALRLFVLLGQLFEEVALTKPVTSRPASGERFLLCLRLRHTVTDGVRQEVVNALWGVCRRIEHAMGAGAAAGDATVAMWPFHVPPAAAAAACAYLGAVNESHLLVQLVEHYKILSLAEDEALIVPAHAADAARLLAGLGDLRLRLPTADEGDGPAQGKSAVKSKAARRRKRRRAQRRQQQQELQQQQQEESECVGTMDGAWAGEGDCEDEEDDEGEGLDGAHMDVNEDGGGDAAAAAAAAAAANAGTGTGADPHAPPGHSAASDGTTSIRHVALLQSRAKPLRSHEYFKLWGVYTYDVTYY